MRLIGRRPSQTFRLTVTGAPGEGLQAYDILVNLCYFINGYVLSSALFLCAQIKILYTTQLSK